jgi:DNA (cytosine-5)-methyltransferase 1
MTHGSLFSGIGGFDLAAEWMGWENIFHCEWNEFGKKVLKHYWPNAISYNDITKTDFTIHRGQIDILTGGFPCQPYSTAGKRLGKEDDRHLWPEMLRAIREIQPRWVVGENVYGLVNWSGGMVFHEIKDELEAEGYEVQPYVLPAIGVGFTHIRERVWIVAYKPGMGRQDVQSEFRERNVQEQHTERYSEKTNRQKETAILDPSCNTFLWYEKMYGEPPVFSMDDGLPFELDGITVPSWIESTIKAAGNAIVPQVALQIFKAINNYEN